VTVTLESADGVFALAGGDEQSFEVEDGEEAQLDVTFTPVTFREYTGNVRVESNDEENPVATVRLIGEGADLPFPDIEIEPSRTVEAEEVPLGESELLSFEIHNVGGAPLDLGEIRIEGGSEFAAVSFPNGVIEVGQWASAFLSYTPTDEVGDDAVIVIPSNDPDEPEMTVLALGNGGSPDFEYPVAVIDCPKEVLLAGPEYTFVDGSASYDPNGLPLFYAWSVTQRPAAADQDKELDPFSLSYIELYTDVAGLWEVQLLVFNELGTLSEPAVCQFVAIPEDNLHVELSWDGPAADVDLHLVQSGSALFDDPEDCHYCNKNPDWGEDGVSDDDPRLDIDDLGGFGPENINILLPEDGSYEVWAHYFAPHGDGLIVANVDVWLGGILVYTGSRAVAHLDAWHVGTADWPAGTFVADPAPSVVQPPPGPCE
jgi:hypothetical protein